MFPGPNASIIRNEAGEPIGWDYPSDDSSAYYCDVCGIAHTGPCGDGWDHDEDDEDDEDDVPDGTLASSYPEPFAGFGGE